MFVLDALANKLATRWLSQLPSLPPGPFAAQNVAVVVAAVTAGTSDTQEPSRSHAPVSCVAAESTFADTARRASVTAADNVSSALTTSHPLMTMMTDPEAQADI